MKRFLLMLGVAAMAGGVCASPLTPEQALGRLDKSGARKIAGKSANRPRLVHTAKGFAGEATLYVFNNHDNSGYMLVSADDVAVPLLGYCDTEGFDETEMSPEFKYWIGEYSRQIEYAASRNLPAENATRATRATHAAVAPMLKTTWDQGSPYNNLTPTDSKGQHAYTGCVATAMAQVMKYWNYPQKAVGTVTLSEFPVGYTGRQSLNLGKQDFDWTNMLDSYSGSYTDAQADAVAWLMQACGYSCDMKYSVGGSGASSFRAALAFSQNFLYNKNINYCQRDFYSASEWDELVYGELAAGRPVMYGGQSTSVGHQFVCDGYDGNGYYHFDWGWSGMSNGYFLLDALDPDSVGAGGGAGGGYNYGQDIMTGIQPTETAAPVVVLSQFGNLSGSVSNRTLSLALSGSGYWVNASLITANISIGVMFEPVNGGTSKWVEVANSESLSGLTSDGSYRGWKAPMTVSVPTDLADGKYKVTVCSADKGQNSEAQPVRTEMGCVNYFYVTKTGSSYVVENVTEKSVTLESAEFTTSLYYGSQAKLSIKVKNNTDEELTQGFYPRFYVGNTCHLLGEGIVLTLQPGEEVTKEFSTLMELSTNGTAPTKVTSYTFKMYDPISGTEYGLSSTVSMRPAAAVNITVNSLAVPNAQTVKVTTSKGTIDAYSVWNKNNIPFEMSVTNTGQFFAYPISLGVFEPNQTSTYVIVSMNPTLNLERGETAVVKGILQFGDAKTGTIYTVSPYYRDPSGNNPIRGTSIYFVYDPSGVEESVADGFSLVCESATGVVSASSESGVASLEVFDMSGRKVAAAYNGAELNVTLEAKGVYVAVAKDASGKTRSIKVMR